MNPTVNGLIPHSSSFIDLRKVNHGYSRDDIRSASGVKTKIKGNQIIALLPEILNRLISDEAVLKEVLYEYKINERLLRSADGKKTRQIATRIQYYKPRMYCFLSQSKKREW